MKCAFASAALLAATFSATAADTWVKVSESTDLIYDVKSGSVQRGTTDRSSEPIIAFLVRTKDKRSSSTQFEKNYVTLADCELGYGKLVTTDLDGKAKYSTDFVLEGGNVASTLAEALCALAARPASDLPADFRATPTSR